MSRSVVIVSPYGGEYGPARVLEHVARAAALAGLRPVCVVRSPEAVSPGLRALEPEVHVVPRLATVPRTLDPRRLGRFALEYRAAAAEVAALAQAAGAALVYSISEANLVGGAAARRLGLPSATHVIGMSIQSPRALARVYVPVLDRVTTGFVACSSAAAAMLVRNGVAQEKVEVVHNSISLDAVDASRSLARPIASGGPAVGMVAAYDRRKGHDLFVDAAAIVAELHPDVRFFLVGGALGAQPESVAFEAEVSRLIAARGLSGRIEQVGYVAPPELYAWVRALDIVVAPSRTEGFAHAVVEAMACSRPIVATAVEGNLDAIVPEESGLLVEPTAPRLADGIASLLDDPERARDLGARARARAERLFDEKVSLPALARRIEALVGRSAQSWRGAPTAPG